MERQHFTPQLESQSCTQAPPCPRSRQKHNVLQSQLLVDVGLVSPVRHLITQLEAPQLHNCPALHLQTRAAKHRLQFQVQLGDSGKERQHLITQLRAPQMHTGPTLHLQQQQNKVMQFAHPVTAAQCILSTKESWGGHTDLH